MEERRFRVGSLCEWTVAAVGALAVTWLISVPVQRLIGPRVEASLVEAPTPRPTGVPVGATSVPVLLLLNGGELRHGELHSRMTQLLPDKLVDGPIVRSTGEFGERYTRRFVANGMKFFVVCEQLEPGGPMRVSGIYLP